MAYSLLFNTLELGRKLDNVLIVKLLAGDRGNLRRCPFRRYLFRRIVLSRVLALEVKLKAI